MAAVPAPFNSYFLGLELATDQLRAAVVDANLTVLGYETVDFDSELQYGSVDAALVHITTSDRPLTFPLDRTRGGLFSTPGDAYTTPVDMWVKAMGEIN